MFKCPESNCKKEYDNINVPKVICNERNQLIYMSRSLIPGFKDHSMAPVNYRKQVCIYAFNKSELRSYTQFGKKSILESFEDIEILRFFELNISVEMVELQPTIAVDVPGDVILVEAALLKMQKQN